MLDQSSIPQISHPLVSGSAPEWASGWGQDRFGIFAEFTVVAENRDHVTQRMRWLPAGHFKMGSVVEPKRDNEQPQHDVTLSRSFWIFDTPCTQALWEAVMGANPSRFIDVDRPVENVSWGDTVEFTAKLNSQIAGLGLRLPTEAEWEYACRASTVEATYNGRLDVLGENNAPVIDEISWYGGNSGHEFDMDLESGVSSTSWLNKQYPHTVAGTRKVASKTPNDWGLHDMLGNVWEWCQDWYHAEYYKQSPTIDPVGPSEGHGRVLRGGGWGNNAQNVRSAFRYDWPPDNRYDDIGFRCAQVHES